MLHPEGAIHRDRGDPEGHVLQHLDKDPAQAEHDGRAEGGVVDRSADHLGAGGRHLGDQNAVNIGIGLVLPGVVQDGLERRAHAVGVLDVDLHPAGIALVQDVRRDDLQDDGVAALCRDPDRLIRRLGQRGLGHRNLVAGE